jgi:hypothetical protein
MAKRIDFPIEKLIPYGKKNAITREELYYQIKTMGYDASDRCIRQLIEEAKRERGAYIVNNGDGYFFPTIEEYEDLQTYILTQESRAKSIFDGIKGHKAFLEDILKGRIADEQLN